MGRKLLLTVMALAGAALVLSILADLEEDDEAAADHCLGRTRSGKACSRTPEPGSSFCWQHQP